MAKFYVVWNGVKPGIYDNWGDCEENVKGYSNASYKSFKTYEEALKAFEEGVPDKSLISNIKKDPISKKIEKHTADVPIIDSLAVDGACSGNPGTGEYRCVDVKTDNVIFHEGPFLSTTNNLMEYFALVDAIKYILENNLDLPIYSDSNTAIAWVKNKKCNSKIKSEKIKEYENYIKSIDLNKIKILKWDTKHWGEIPADFGRK